MKKNTSGFTALCISFLLLMTFSSPGVTARSYPSSGLAAAGIFPSSSSKRGRQGANSNSPKGWIREGLSTIRNHSTTNSKTGTSSDAFVRSTINWSRGGSSPPEEEITFSGLDNTVTDGDGNTIPPPPAMVSKEGYDIEEAVSTVWNRHRRWSIAAGRQKNKIQFYRACHLSFMVAGAVFQTLATRFSHTNYGWINSLAGGVCLGAAPFISNTFLSKESKSDWIRCRSTSERIKAEVYRFRAGVTPYDSNTPVQTLVNRVADISDSSKDLKLFYVMAIGDGKEVPPQLDRSTYIKYRLGTQIEGFYIPTARKLAKKSSMLNTCQGILAAGSAAIGLVAGSAGGAMSGVANQAGQTVASNLIKNVGMWGAALATAAAAFGTHIASTRYDDEVMEWSTAAQRLENLYLRLPKNVGPGSDEWSDFVLSCEEIIASNTKNWANVVASTDAPRAKKKAMVEE